MPIDEEAEEYPGEVYDMYQGGSRASRGSNRQPRQQPRYMEDEDAGSDYDEGSIDSGEFEMMPPARRGAPSSAASSSRAASRRAPEIRKIRVKVHAPGDVRYVMVGAAVEYTDLVDRIRDKFAFRKKFKIKFKDEDMPDGEMITMGDQDDLDMAISSARQAARKARQDVGKLDVSHLPQTMTIYYVLTNIADLDSGDLDGYTLMALRPRLASNDLMALYTHSTQAFLSNLITFLPVFLFL